MTSWTAYDAKYRSGRANVLEAMTSAHVYRDALRWSERSAEAALLLVPTLNGIETLASVEYRARNAVGVELAVPGV